MLEVAEHYQHFGGVSPINEQNRRLIAALERELAEHGPQLPVYWGNRNWHPLLADTLRQMADDGVHASARLSSPAPTAPTPAAGNIAKTSRPRKQSVGTAARKSTSCGVLQSSRLHRADDRARAAGLRPKSRPNAEIETLLIFTAHSIPQAMAAGCHYEAQLREACRLVAEAAGHSELALVYQSRSGPPHSRGWSRTYRRFP